MADEVSIDAISLEISAETQKASAGIEALISSLNKLSTGIPGSYKNLEKFTKTASSLGEVFTAELAANVSAVGDGIDKIANSAKALSSKNIKKIKEVSSSLQQMGGGTIEINSYTKPSQIASSQDVSAPASGQKPGQTSGTQSTAQQLSQTADATHKAGTEAKKAQGTFGKLFESIKRVAVYRLIRTALKNISQALSESTKAYEEFDRTYGNGKFTNNIAEMRGAMDSWKYSAGITAVQLESTFAPVLEVVGNALTWATNAFNEFGASMRGESTYTRVNTEYLKEYNKELQETKRQLLGFDQINKLQANLDTSKLYVEDNVRSIDAIVGGAEALAGVAGIGALAISTLSKYFKTANGGTGTVESLAKAFANKNSTLEEQNALESEASETVSDLGKKIAGTAAAAGAIIVPFKKATDAIKNFGSAEEDALGQSLISGSSSISSQMTSSKPGLSRVIGVGLAAGGIALAASLIKSTGGGTPGILQKDLQGDSRLASMYAPAMTTRSVSATTVDYSGIGGGNWTIQIVDPSGNVKNETTITAAQRINMRNGKTMIPLRG